MMNERGRRSPSDLAPIMRELDPARRDAAYWVRFRQMVVQRAASELARRRTVPLTLSQVLSSWSRALFPAAGLTAAVAALLIIQPGEPEADAARTFTAGSVVGMEELLLMGLEGETIPGVLGSEDAEPVITFASDNF